MSRKVTKKKFFPSFWKYFWKGVPYGHDFFDWRKDLGWVDFPDSLRIFIKPTENFIKTFEKNFHLKNWGLSEYSNLTFDFIFQNFNFFDSSWHRIISLCRTVTIFSLTQRSVFGTLSRYREHVCKVHRKCGRSFKKSFTPQKIFFQNIPIFQP